MSTKARWRDSHRSEIAHGDNDLPRDEDADSSMAFAGAGRSFDPLWTPEQVARRLNVSPDWVRDHSSRKQPRLPVIRLGGGPAGQACCATALAILKSSSRKWNASVTATLGGYNAATPPQIPT